MKSQTIERENGTLHIITNGIPRHFLYWYELSEDERKYFDYLETDDEQDSAAFFRYRGNVYSLDGFMRSSSHDGAFSDYDGIAPDSFFSGIAIKIVNDGDSVIVARYYS